MLLLLVSTMGMAQNKAIQSFLSYTTYNVPGDEPFIENALAFDCSSVVYRQYEPGCFKATVEVQTIFKKGDKVYTFSKIALDSPMVKDTTKITGAFIDQQRFPLENGEYLMEITVKDLNNPKQIPYKSEQTVVINFPANQPAVSDILLVESYQKAVKNTSLTKSGYDMIPRVYAFYAPSVENLTFYAELYNSDKIYKDGGQYMLSYYIQSYESSVKMKDFSFVKRMDVGPVNILLNTINIKNLPTGNYYLVVEMHDRNNNLMASNSVFFQRYNPGCEVKFEDLASTQIEHTFAANFNNLDTIREYIRCLNPCCSETERDYANNLIKTDDLKTINAFTSQSERRMAGILQPGETSQRFLFHKDQERLYDR